MVKSKMEKRSEFGKILKFFTFLFWQTRLYKLIAMIDESNEQRLVYITKSRNGVPVLLAHVVAGGNARVLLPQLYSPFGFTLQVCAFKIFNVAQREHFSAHFKNKCSVVEGKMLCGSRLTQAILAKRLDIHGLIVSRTRHIHFVAFLTSSYSHNNLMRAARHIANLVHGYVVGIPNGHISNG